MMSDSEKVSLPIPSDLPESKVPALVIGLAAPVGVNLKAVKNSVMNALSQVQYQCECIKLTDLLKRIPRWSKATSIYDDERYHDLMTRGNELRSELEMGDALAILAIGAIRERREEINSDPKKPLSRRAFILHSLKNPYEVETLRKTYGSTFLLISAYEPPNIRLDNLARKIAASHSQREDGSHGTLAQELIIRDESEEENEYGQNMRETFPLADLFVDVANESKMGEEIHRFVKLLFGYPFETPTREEHGMYHAHATALRSASLARQVGAAITTEDGDIVALGCNDVPKANGGLYWKDDPGDTREFKKTFDENDSMKRAIFAELIERMKTSEWLSVENQKTATDELVAQAFKKKDSLLRGTQLNSLLEFSPCVHAEMAALTDAARRGIPVKKCWMYVTTFPCHGCAKHLVAAGIVRVFFIEPFPKSRVSNLHKDSICVGEENPDHKVIFLPFVGIAPRKYMALFSISGIRRKDDEGKKLEWEAEKSAYRLTTHFPSLDEEEVVFHKFHEKMIIKGIWDKDKAPL